MTGAISTSLSGLQSAAQRINVAAGDIVKSGALTSSNRGGDTGQAGAGQARKSGRSGGPVQINLSPVPDLASSVVDLKLAEISYKASAKALKAVLETQRNFLDQIR